MDLEISSPRDKQNEVIHDLIASRRGRIVEIIEEKNHFGKKESDRSQIKAVIPLMETIGYSTFLRSISKVTNIIF